jgi:hypothetical protein
LANVGRHGRDSSAIGVYSRSFIRVLIATAMSRTVYFHQHCPVCGRMLQVRVNLLGQRVYCQHCGGGFVAMDEQLRPTATAERSAAERVDELLEQAALVIQQASDDAA